MSGINIDDLLGEIEGIVCSTVSNNDAFSLINIDDFVWIYLVRHGHIKVIPDNIKNRIKDIAFFKTEIEIDCVIKPCSALDGVFSAFDDKGIMDTWVQTIAQAYEEKHEHFGEMTVGDLDEYSLQAIPVYHYFMTRWMVVFSKVYGLKFTEDKMEEIEKSMHEYVTRELPDLLKKISIRYEMIKRGIKKKASRKTNPIQGSGKVAVQNKSVGNVVVTKAVRKSNSKIHNPLVDGYNSVVPHLDKFQIPATMGSTDGALLMDGSSGLSHEIEVEYDKGSSEVVIQQHKKRPIIIYET